MHSQFITRLGRSFLIAGAAVILVGQTGCIPGGGTQFREAALPAIETGVSSILNGVLDGIFAAIEVESDTTGA